MRIDHVALDVADYERSKAFYEKALAPIGMKLLAEPAGNNIEAVCHKPE